LNEWKEGREVLPNSSPDRLEVHAKVIVDELVAHAGDVSPRNLRVLLANTGWDFFRRLSDYLQGMYDGIAVLSSFAKDWKVIPAQNECALSMASSISSTESRNSRFREG
jgi:hypothetical protein